MAASCTDSTRAYPLFHLDGCNFSGHCNPLGDYRDYWVSLLRGAVDRLTGDREYAALIPTAFCWNPGCARASAARARSRAAAFAARAAVPAQPGGNRFGLINGTNRISLSFGHPRGSRRPPSIHMSGGSRCRAERMHTSVHDGVGRLDLVLVCRGLKPAGVVRLTVARAVTRRFRLRRNGAGTVRVRLKRPPGKVEPYMHVSYGRSSTPCPDVGHALRLGSTTMELLVDARCGRAARGATAHLHVGGLLAGTAARRDAPGPTGP